MCICHLTKQASKTFNILFCLISAASSFQVKIVSTDHQPKIFFSLRWYVRRLVVRCITVISRQQLPAGGERIPEPPTVGQHAHDAQDQDSAILCVFSWGHARRRPANPTSLQHRRSRTQRFHYQPVAADGKPALFSLHISKIKETAFNRNVRNT